MLTLTMVPSQEPSGVTICGHDEQAPTLIEILEAPKSTFRVCTNVSPFSFINVNVADSTLSNTSEVSTIKSAPVFPHHELANTFPDSGCRILNSPFPS